MDSSLASARIFQIASHYSFYSGCITFSTGIVGNILNILVFTHLKFFRNNRCIFFLTVETISDFIYQFFSITLTILISMYGNDLTGTSLIWCRLKYLLAQLCGLVTFSMICFAAGDQFFSTNYRFNRRPLLCTLKLSGYLVFFTVFLWFIHSILCTFFVNILPLVGCVITNQIWIRYATFFFYPVLVGFLPILVASIFSFLAFRNVRLIVRRQIPIVRRRFDRQITAMVLLRVVAFVFFTLPYIVFRIYIVNITITQANLLQYAITQLVQAIVVSIVSLNYTANFYIFIASSSRYRRQVKYVLMRKCWHRWKDWFCTKRNQVAPAHAASSGSNFELE